MPARADKNQVVFKKGVVKGLKFNNELSYYLKPFADKMHLLSQTSGSSAGRLELYSITLDKDLKIVKKDSQNTWKEKGIYLGINYGYELNTNNTLFLGRYQNKTGIMVVNYVE